MKNSGSIGKGKGKSNMSNIGLKNDDIIQNKNREKKNMGNSLRILTNHLLEN